MSDEVTRFFEEKMAAENIPGISAAVVKADGSTWMRGFGMADLEQETGATPETVYEIASVTKLFTTTAVLRLAQAGKIKLEERLARYLPHLPKAWHAVTIQHVLSHQSGLPSYTDTEIYWETTRLDISQETLLSYVNQKRLLAEPTAQYRYDNTGFYLLGHLIEAVTGEAYDTFLEAEVLQPLGMACTRANDPYTIVKNRAHGYSYDDAQQCICHKPYYSVTGTYSAGVLLSSVADLAKFAGALYSDILLAPEWRRAWWTPKPSRAGNERRLDFSVGLGWFIVDHPHGRFAGHNGGVVGFASAFLHLLESRTTLILLCNQDKVAKPHEIVLAAWREGVIPN